MYNGRLTSELKGVFFHEKICEPGHEKECFFLMQTTVMILSFQTKWSGQIVQTQIRLLLEEQSDLGLHCLLFHLHLFDEIPLGLAALFEF